MRTFCQMAVSLGVLSVVGCASSAVARKPAAGEASAASAARETAAAGAPVRPVPPSPPVACRLSVEDEHGQPLPTYAHQGKTWVLGTLGQRYVVRVSNHGPGRVEAVVSVDGRDVVSGEVADYRQQRGYLVHPGDSVVIDGFRQSFESVAAFRFVSPGRSYSARRGTPQNTGIIGVACFAEKPRAIVVAPPPRPNPPVYGHRHADAAGAVPAEEASAPSGAPPPMAPKKEGAARQRSYEPAPSASTDHLGTQYGESHYSPVHEVPFQRWHRTRPSRLITLRYDDAAGLQARGIDVYPEWRYSAPPHDPQAFPTRFAAPVDF